LSSVYDWSLPDAEVCNGLEIQDHFEVDRELASGLGRFSEGAGIDLLTVIRSSSSSAVEAV
jgi:hypothetical protein